MNNPHTITKNFVQTLQQAAKGRATSLPFIRHALPDNPIVQDGDIFQVIVAGGSCFQKALMRKTGSELEIISNDEGNQPTFDTKQTLFEFLASHLDPKVTVLALNFAYPIKPITRGDVLDGVLIRGTKENNFDGLAGQAIGEEFEKYIKQTQDRDLKVACANDTICLLMSGLIAHDGSNLAAGIVGTGLNFAIFLDEHTAVNLESSNFDGFERSDAGRAIDELSQQKGTSVYEKEVAGAYMYRHVNFLSKQRNLAIPELSATKEVDMYAQSEDHAVAEAAKEVLHHSAELVAVQIAGLMKFLERDLTFVMQGSVYWKGYNYKEMVQELVTQLCPEYKASFEKGSHSDLYGAAKLIA